MIKQLQLFLFFLSSFSIYAQVLDPVQWKMRTEKVSDTEYTLIFEAAIDPDWHVYSQFTPDGGPLPLEFSWENAKGRFEPVGKAKESAYKKQYNDIFEVEEYYFEKTFSLRQRIRLLAGFDGKVSGTINYQVCKEVCINQEEDFSFTLPVPQKPAMAGPATAEVDSVIVAPAVAPSPGPEISPAPPVAPAAETGDSLWGIFFFAFLGGFAALLTPCVFPMIPMTVSFFTKQSKTPAQGKRNALIYGISIILIYLVLGSLVTAIFGAEALNELSTDVWFNLIFFVILIVFAFSFLGAFEIVLPNSWANKVDRQADRGGIVGILFMALALAIVSFSCTGPIVGTLLVESASRGGVAPLVGMLGFSSALALPFMLFAMFPGWLNSLPKSGGWLNTVKVSLGFLELALALKFISNADLVLQLHLLEREVFLAIWIAIFGTWGLYLLGKVNLPHDAPLQNISVGRLSLALLVLSFTVYMIPGLWGAPLKLISAFPPPPTYSESPFGVGASQSVSEPDLPPGAEAGPHGLPVFTEYEAGMAYARQVNRPVMLDFTGYACVNCRKMENNVWSDPKVLALLRDKLVIISLYVDDKRKLPENEQFTSAETGKRIKTVGNKWADFMITKYRTNTQPYYVLTDLEGNSLNSPVSYTPDIKVYEAWLLDGVSRFGKTAGPGQSR